MYRRNPTFKTRLRAVMDGQGLKRPHLARQMNVSVSSVARWLRGENPPLLALAKALGCSAAYLIGERDTPERGVFLTEDERIMLELYQRLTSSAKRAVISTVQEAHAALEKERIR